MKKKEIKKWKRMNWEILIKKKTRRIERQTNLTKQTKFNFGIDKNRFCSRTYELYASMWNGSWKRQQHQTDKSENT